MIPPEDGNHVVGDYVLSPEGDKWICTVSGNPGTWVMLRNSLLRIPSRLDRSSLMHTLQKRSLHRQVITQERDNLARVECDTCTISVAIRHGAQSYQANAAEALALWRERHDINNVPRGIKDRY